MLRGSSRSKLSPVSVLLTSAFSLLFIPAVVWSQTALEEITVTASKRGASNVQDLSMSISALGGDTLEAMGAVEFTDFSRSIAGLDVVDVGPGQKRYLVRGLNLPGESTVGLLFDNITMSGTGADAGDFGRNQSDLDLFDVERVEVLRGPQGTQYGANSVSGVVRIITNKPDPTAFDGKLVVGGAGKEDGDADWNVKGMVNIPLSDDLAVRGVGYISETGGFIDNMQLNKDPSCYGVGTPADGPEIILLPSAGCDDGTSNAKDINSHRREGGRLSMQWTPTDATRVLLQGYYQSIDSDGRNATHPLGATAFAPPRPDIIAARGGSNEINTPAVGERQTVVKSHEPYSEDMWIAALEIEHDFDWATGTISASLTDRSGTTRLDSSNPARLHRTFQTVSLGPWGVNGVGPGTGAFSGAIISPTDRVRLWQDFDTEVTNFEARLASQFEGRTNFLLGLYYQENVRTVDSEGRIGDPATGLDMAQADIVALFDPQSLINFNNAAWQTDPFTITARGAVNTTETKAVYGEVYFDLTDQIELMGGARYFETDREQVSSILTPFANAILIQFGSPAGMVGPEPNTPSHESDALFKGQITYRPTEDHQIYLQVSEGYRAGGVNATLVSAIPPSYDSDKTSNLEGGLKTTWLDGRVIANLSVYNVDWDNVQFEVAYTQQFNALVNCTQASDAVSATGVEIDFQAAATDNLDVGFNYTTIEAEWGVDANDCLTQTQIDVSFDDDGVGLGDGSLIQAGDTLIGVPDYSGSAYGQYNFASAPFGADSAWIRADVMFQGTVPVNDDDTAINLANPSYVLANLNAGIDFGKYSFNVFVRNLMDEDAHLSLFQGFQQDNRVTPSNPRTFGASFTYNFGE